MGLFDTLKEAVGGIVSQVGDQAVAGVLGKVLGNTEGGLAGIVEMAKSAGLGEQVSSWLGNGQNLPISAEQITSILGEERLAQIAGMVGMQPETITNFVAEHLPGIIDRASPNGTIEGAPAEGSEA